MARRRHSHRGLIAFFAFLALFAIAFSIARYYFSGPRLAHFLVKTLFPPERIRGRVEIDSVDWPVLGIAGRNLNADVYGLRIYAPEELGGNLVLSVPHATAVIDWPRVAFPPHNVSVDDLVVDQGEALIRQVRVADAAASADGKGEFEIGFIAALQPRPRPGRPGGPGNPGPVILLDNMRLSNVDVHLEFDKWNAHIYGVKAQGVLRNSFERPGVLDFTYLMRAHVERASVEFAKQHFDLVDITANRFGQYPGDKYSLQWSAAGKTIEGAIVQLDGKLHNVYDPDPWKSSVELRVGVHDAADLLARLSKGYLGGGRPAGTVEIQGPMPAPVIIAEGRGMPLVTAVPVTIDHVLASLRVTDLQLEATHAELSALEGKADASGKFNLLTNVLSTANVEITEPMNVAPYLPPKVLEEAGSPHMTGHAHLSAVPPALSANRLELQLGRVHAEGSVRVIGDLVYTSGLSLQADDATGRVSGRVLPRAGKLDLDWHLESNDLEPHLKRMQLMPLAHAVNADGTIGGTFDRPVVSASGIAIGAPMTPRIDADVTYTQERGGAGRLDVRRLSADPLGGHATGSGSLLLGRTLRLVDARADATGVDLSLIPGTDARLTGRGDVHVQASGPIDSPRGKAEAHLTGVSFDKHNIGELATRAVADDRGLHVEELRVGGESSGTLAAQGLVGWPARGGRRLDLTLQASGLPLSLIPQPPPEPGSRPLNLGGKVGADLRVQGTTEKPAAAGKIMLAGIAIFDAALGGGTLDVDTREGQRIGLRGDLFQGKLGVDGTVALGGPTGIDARGRFTVRKLELEELFSDIAERIGAHAWVSGFVDVATSPRLTAVAHLDQVRFDFEGTDAEGRPNPIIVENRGEIIAAADAGRQEVSLLAPVTLVSSNGEFTIDGSAARDKLALRLHGDVQLRLLELFSRDLIEEARGSLRVNVALGGNFARPTLDGDVSFRDAAVVPRDQESEIRVPSGSLLFSLDKLRADAVTVEVEGQSLVLNGSMALQALRPVSLDARVDGRVAGKLMEVLAPEQVSHGAGSAAIAVAAKGPISAPAISGLLVFDQRLEVTPRALRRELAIKSGRIHLANQQLLIEDNLAGEIDEGTFVVSSKRPINLRPLSADVHVDLDGISHRVPGVLELELAAGVDLQYRSGGLKISGKIDVIDGRFVQKLRFDQIAKSILVPAQTTEVSDPFWKGSPLLANMDLDLKVDTTGTFQVTNEIADLGLAGGVTLSGTPPHPIFSGQVRLDGEGSLRFPGIKIRKFVVSVAQVVFSPYYRFPDKTPTFLVQADAPFVDYSGTEHKVFLEVSGTLPRIEWRLWTSTGLNQAQTFALISTGRTPEQLLGRVRGDAGSARSGTDPTTGLPMTGSGADSPFDEWAKSVSGEIIDTLAADNLRNALGLDCLSLAVSGSSIRGSLCKKLGQLMQLSFEGERGVLDFYRYEVNLSARPTDDVSAVIQYWGLRSDQILERTRNELRFQLEYRFMLR